MKKRSTRTSASRGRWSYCESFAIGWPALDAVRHAASGTALAGFVADEGIKIGDIIHAVRVATTGKAVGAGALRLPGDLGARNVS